MIFGVYRFLSMAISTCNTIGNSVATVVVAKWSGTFDAEAARRHLYPELYPAMALADEEADNPAVQASSDMPLRKASAT